MKENYLKEQYILQAEQKPDFFRNARSVSTRADVDALEKQYDAKAFASTLAPYVASDPEILKLYLAAHISACTAAGHKAGLPIQICENLKKEAFVKIAKAKTNKDLSGITDSVLRSMKEASKKYTFHNCSHVIQRAVDYIHIQKFQPLSASDVARHLDAERTHLSKQFHAEIGMTLTDYIHTVKTETAMSLITTHEYSLVEISDLLGYSSYRYFAQVYKKYQGCLPSQTAAMTYAQAPSNATPSTQTPSVPAPSSRESEK